MFNKCLLGEYPFPLGDGVDIETGNGPVRLRHILNYEDEEVRVVQKAIDEYFRLSWGEYDF